METSLDNTSLYRKSIPRTMPMLPQDPKKGHKQSRGIELEIPPEEIRRLLMRMEEYLAQEATYYTNKINIDRAGAHI